ncbi:MAG: MFS transporter [Chloroflexi bacterium]|nr:MFS transporter [Chloroflexota bacterium]
MLGNWARTTFLALRNREYRILWVGTTIAFLVFMMSSIVQSVVAFDLTGKNSAVGAVALGMGLATILVAPFGGVLADRISKRRLLLIGQGVIAIDFLAVGALIVAGQITLAALIASTFVMGVVFSFIAPARQAWIGEILPKETVGNGIALQQVSMTLTRVFGPFVAGALIALPFVRSGGTYLVMGGLITLVVLTLAQMPQTQSRRRAGGPSLVDDLRGGIEHVAGRPQLLVLAASFMGIVVFGFTYQVILPGFLDHGLGRSTADVTWLYGAGAIGGLGSTVGMASLAGSRHAWRLMLVAGTVLALALAATAVAQTFALALFTMFFVGAGSSSFQMLNNALVLQESSPVFYGRVMSLTMLAWGLNGLAGYPFGLIADATGERATLGVMAAFVLATTAVTGAAHVVLLRRSSATLRSGVSAETARVDRVSSNP